MEENLDLNTKFRNRTKKFAIDIVRFFKMYCKREEEMRILGKQLLRAGTSVASNFRAFTRGRSEAEKYAKICIVVEEVDETQFWMELMEEAELLPKSVFVELKKKPMN